MFKKRAKKFLAVAMVMAMILALQIPAFAVPLADFSISIAPVADPATNSGKMMLTVESTSWASTGTSPGQLIIEYSKNGGGTYTTVADLAINESYTGYQEMHDIVLLGDTNITWRARYIADTVAETNGWEDTTSNELLILAGIHSELFADGAGGLRYDVGHISSTQTGLLELDYTVGGTTTELKADVTLDATYLGVSGMTVGAPIATMPTETTTYSFKYTPDADAVALGYEVIEGSAVYNPTYLQAPTAVDGYTVASIAGTVPELDALVKAADAANALSLQVTSSVAADMRLTDALDIIKNQMGLSNHAKVTLPGGVLVADLDIKYATAPDALDLNSIANFPDSNSMINVTLTGLKAHDRVALLTLDMDRAINVSYATVSASGEATFNVPALEVENITGGVGTADYSAYLYANVPQTPVPVPVPVPVSPSTGVYN